MQQPQKDNKNFIVLTISFTVLMLGLILCVCWVLKSKQEPTKEETFKPPTQTYKPNYSNNEGTYTGSQVNQNPYLPSQTFITTSQPHHNHKQQTLNQLKPKLHKEN
ncbi:hypothetical protein HPP_4720 [Hydrangea phyllody phytoplasma]|uniref:Uncharacterized protein n=2 Tax=16SrI (Aster yellows group) TaxID=3042590 RepID=A0ABQ5PSE0_9MOLU|nr:hypothetical protein [Hydrangea phyllody phytoplasma]GFZ75514.1 hypothetical protein HPP_4720 [Hydrangea phyllody phytoplasma]GLH61260.1 hypothetical protein RHYP_2050 [Rhus yellows phytoplasma]GLH62035.1 hypothetical protein HP2P_4420 [Hydrangea phyllody phytoplasma]